MNETMKLLVPVPPEGLVPDVVRALNALSAAEVELFAVVPAQSRVNPHTGLPDTAFEQASWNQDRSQTVEWLEGLPVSLTCGTRSHQAGRGAPAETIVERARGGGFTFIVMATRGNTGLKRMVLGSVTDHVVRSAPCPVVVVPPGASAG